VKAVTLGKAWRTCARSKNNRNAEKMSHSPAHPQSVSQKTPKKGTGNLRAGCRETLEKKSGKRKWETARPWRGKNGENSKRCLVLRPLKIREYL
jgi:hypothetical protein